MVGGGIMTATKPVQSGDGQECLSTLLRLKCGKKNCLALGRWEFAASAPKVDGEGYGDQREDADLPVSRVIGVKIPWI
jgi:hypothetical protein